MNRKLRNILGVISILAGLSIISSSYTEFIRLTGFSIMREAPNSIGPIIGFILLIAGMIIIFYKD